MQQQKKHHIIAIVAIFCLLYIILALRPLGTELHISPDWTIPIDRTEDKKDDDILIPFRLGQNIGYFTVDGRVTTSTAFPFNAAISDSYYALYGANNDSAVFYRADGTLAGTLEVPGFPFFDEDRIFVFLPGGSAVAQYAENGARLWEFEHYAPITAFHSSTGGTVVGFADGTLVSLTPDGTIDQRYAPGGSEIPIILGADISDNGNLIACVSGQKQQRFVVSKKDSEQHPKIIFHEYLPQEFNRQVLVKFNKKASAVYYNYKGGLGIVDISSLKPRSAHIPIDGTIVQIEESDVANLVFILSRNGGTYTLTVLEPFNHVLATSSFTAESAFMQTRDSFLFLGKDNKISRFTISRR